MNHIPLQGIAPDENSCSHSFTSSLKFEQMKEVMVRSGCVTVQLFVSSLRAKRCDLVSTDHRSLHRGDIYTSIWISRTIQDSCMHLFDVTMSQTRTPICVFSIIPSVKSFNAFRKFYFLSYWESGELSNTQTHYEATREAQPSIKTGNSSVLSGTSKAH